jgi:hypothetical protein
MPTLGQKLYKTIPFNFRPCPSPLLWHQFDNCLCNFLQCNVSRLHMYFLCRHHLPPDKSENDWFTLIYDCCHCFLRLYSKTSLTLKEWRFNLSFPWVSVLFFNSWRVSSRIVRYDTNPPAIQKHHWHSREAQIEPPLFEYEWAFRIQALVFNIWVSHALEMAIHFYFPNLELFFI